MRSRSWTLPLLLVGFATVGCGEEPTVPTGPDPVGGGDTFVLDAALYAQVVAPILTRKGCDAGGQCHGDGIRGTFQLSPVSNKDADYDFAQASLQVDPYDFAASPILTEPLAVSAGGTVHAEDLFADTDDADYLAILAWIEDGEFQ